MVIPFSEQRWEITHLIAARADIPGFRNQFHLRQHAVAADSLEQRRIWRNSGVRPITEARSKRKPSTWHSSTQKRKHWRAHSTTPGWLRLSVLPHPVQL